jgi:hypothetical protein
MSASVWVTLRHLHGHRVVYLLCTRIIKVQLTDPYHKSRNRGSDVGISTAGNVKNVEDGEVWRWDAGMAGTLK